MKTSENTLGVALTKEACPPCVAVQDGAIVMNTWLTPGEAKKVEDLNGKCIGYMDKPCESCQGIMNLGILLIGIVEAKTTDYKNPYRSGNKWGVTEEYATRLFGDDPDQLAHVLKSRAAFLPVEVAAKLGFPEVKLDA